MRTLTAKQKKILDAAWAVYKPASVDNLTITDWEDLKKANDTEILWQEVDRYLSDKFFEDRV